MVTNLQHVVSRETDPTENVVVSVTKFVGGTTHNVIPGTVEMTGTVRTLKPEVRDRVREIMERIVKGVTAAHGASYSFEYQRGYRPVINDDEVTGVVERTARETLGDEAVEVMSANMGGEDFSAFQQAAPGTFFLVGAGNEEQGVVYPHHHPCFGIDESALPVGVRMFVFAAFELLDAIKLGSSEERKKCRIALERRRLVLDEVQPDHAGAHGVGAAAESGRDLLDVLAAGEELGKLRVLGGAPRLGGARSRFAYLVATLRAGSARRCRRLQRFLSGGEDVQVGHLGVQREDLLVGAPLGDEAQHRRRPRAQSPALFHHGSPSE